MWDTVWMYAMNDAYGNWSASGEADVMEIWHGPVGKTTSFGSPLNSNSETIWFGGAYPENALLYADVVVPTDLTMTQKHTFQFSWDGKGLFIWKLDGIVNFIVGPSSYKLRLVNDESVPFVTNPYGYGSSGSPVIENQPYQGVYVGHVEGNQVVTDAPSPAPFDSSNPFYLMVELQVGGNPLTSIAPENSAIFEAGNNVDLSGVPDGLLSNYDAQQLGLPQRPQAFFTNDQTMTVYYIKYMTLK